MSVAKNSEAKSANSKRASGARGRAGEVLIPDKLYFRIGEVSRLSRLPAYVLRFWETEFPQLKPVKGSTGQRMYRRRDVENVLRIKHLLYDQGFTIAGARQQLREEKKPARTQTGLPFPPQVPNDRLRKLKQDLQEVLRIVSRK